MLKTIGISSLDELYSDIPREVRLNRPLKVDGFASEQEVRSNVEQLLKENKSGSDYNSFLGAGIYNHYIPAAVKHIVSRTEFQTSYTPYQAEISQGLLQSLFEFESMIRDLTAVDAVNSSLYDGSTALGEAARMAVRATGKYKVIVPKSLHPDKLSVLRNYTEPVGIKVEAFEYDKETGGPDIEDLQSKLDHETAAVYCEVPSLFGTLDADVVRIPSLCHEKGALSIIGFDPISLGGLKPPGEYGADIVVAEGQSISSEMNFGGPGLGIIGCRGANLLRQIPGRLIGMTTTIDGTDKAFSMVLQTREQHIRREGATSNICTNQSLMAVAASCYLAMLGKTGLRRLGEVIISNSHYAAKRLSRVDGVTSPLFKGPFFKEFAVGYEGARAVSVYRRMARRGVLGGYPLDRGFRLGREAGLFCVTEVHTHADIERLAAALEEAVKR